MLAFSCHSQVLVVNALNFTRGTEAVSEETLQSIKFKKEQKHSGSEVIIIYSFFYCFYWKPLIVINININRSFEKMLHNAAVLLSAKEFGPRLCINLGSESRLLFQHVLVWQQKDSLSTDLVYARAHFRWVNLFGDLLLQESICSDPGWCPAVL